MNKRKKILIYLFPTFGDMLWITTFFVFLTFGRTIINNDGDLSLHLNLGKYILDTGKIPLKDVFSHTMTGQSVTQHEWLSGIIFELTARFFGLDGIILLCAIIIASTFFLVYKHTQAHSQTSLIAIAIVFLAMIASIIHWHTRPHIFTFLLFALWLIVLRRLRRGKFNYWWLLPILMLVWVNLHGGFIIGFITWGIYGIGLGCDMYFNNFSEDYTLPQNFWHYYLLSGFTSFIASLLNPSRFGLWKTVIFHLGNKYLADTTAEFQSPNFHEIISWPFLLFIVLLIVVLGLHKSRIEMGTLFTVSAWLVLGLYSSRNIPLFVIVASPLMAKGVNDLLLQNSSRFKFIKKFKDLDEGIRKIDMQLFGLFWPLLSIVIVVIGLATGIQFDLEGKGYSFDPKVFPVGAVDWLEENPQKGDMFNVFMWGGYLEYRLWPQERVFIDSKKDFYGEIFFRQYQKVIQQQEGWETIFDQFNVTWAILPINTPAVRGIQVELDWTVIYEDDTAVILTQQ